MSQVLDHEQATGNWSSFLTPIQKDMPPLRVPIGYRFSAWLAAVVLLLVAAFYAAIMLGAAWFALDYLVGHLRLLASDNAGGSLAGYILLGLAVLVLVGLLIKPAFHLPPVALEPITMAEQDQSLMHAYVEQLCRLFGALPPVSIKVVPGPGAAARSRGLASLWSGEMELIIGLSLVAGTTVQELAGVLAHELGHMARRRSWRVQMLIRMINSWFARAIYEQDRFDYWLARLARQRFWPLGLPFLLAGRIVRMGRRLLWLFMILGHAGSCMVSRQEEQDCDRCAARLSGSNAVINALQRAAVLSLAERATLGDVAGSWHDHRLPDDLQKMIVAKADRLPPQELDRIVKQIHAERTRWFDTHPSLVDRVRAMQGSISNGIVNDLRPACTLLRNFQDLCRASTLSFYKHVLKEDFAKSKLVSADALIREHAELEEAHKTVRRYMQGEVLTVRPIFPAAQARQRPSGSDHVSKLRQTREDALHASGKRTRLAGRYIQKRDLEYRLFELRMLEQMGFKLRVSPPPSEPPGPQQRQLQQDMAEMEQVMRQRMTLALQMLRCESTWTRLEHLDPQSTVRQLDALLDACECLERVQGTLHECSQNVRLLAALVQGVDLRAAKRSIRDGVGRLSQTVLDQLGILGNLLGECAYPFEHAVAGVSISQYLIPSMPLKAEPQEVAAAGIGALERIDRLIWRALAKLATFCEQVETSLDLAPQSEPQDVPPRAATPYVAGRGGKAPTAPAMQMALTATVAVIVLACLNLARSASTSYAVLPRYTGYSSTIVPSSWTPPSNNTVWQNGFRPYTPPAQGQNPHNPGVPRMNVAPGQYDPRGPTAFPGHGTNPTPDNGRGKPGQIPGVPYAPPVIPPVPGHGYNPYAPPNPGGGSGPRRP